jgi:hypothetical protein
MTMTRDLVGASVFEEQLIEHFDRHVEEERALIDDDGLLASRTDSEAFRYLARLLERIFGGSTVGPDRGLDRLTAIDEMRAWLDGEEQPAAIGVRMAGCTWIQMGEAIGANRQTAMHRWGQMIARYEHAGLVPPGD